MDTSEQFVSELKKDIIDNELSKTFGEIKFQASQNQSASTIVSLYKLAVSQGLDCDFEDFVKQCVVDTMAMFLAGIDGSFDIGKFTGGLELRLEGEVISGCLREDFLEACELQE